VMPTRPPRWMTAHRGEPARRVGITLLAITIVLTLFAGRLVQIQGMESGYYKAAANAEKLTTKALPALRGTIYGSNGQVLAMTIETYTITADPPQMAAAEVPSYARELAAPLGLTEAQVLNLLQHPSSPDYVQLAKGVSATNEAKIEGYDIPGIAEAPLFVRAYPDGSATANVVGYTNVNLADVISGQSGIEAEYNKLLTGTTGSEEVETGANGETIPLAGTEEKPAVNGESIRLTIDPTLQFQAQQTCEQEVKKTKAANCSVVVIQPKTGAILAMAQWPTYDQNTLTSASQTEDIPDSYLFAPGSTAKVITAAAAFETGGQTPMSAYRIPSSGEIYEGGQWIHDAEDDAGAHYTIAGIIANSSNIGMSQVVKHVTPQTQYDYLRAFGLGEPTGLGLPGEEPDATYSSSALPPPSQWSGDTRYNLSYGQGLVVNAVQMASVYATIANGGVRVQPTLIAGTYNAAGQYTAAKPQPSTRVIQAKTAKQLIPILQQVPGVDNEADQRWGDIAGYAIAAKTGTSSEPSANPKKPCPADNALCVHGSSYIGFPGDDPKVVVAVNVQAPDTSTDYFGDEVAGPVFYSVMTAALADLQIQPQPGLEAPYVRLNAG
jgi:cell division protein FtsI (penicillin-binding protein 3)